MTQVIKSIFTVFVIFNVTTLFAQGQKYDSLTSTYEPLGANITTSAKGLCVHLTVFQTDFEESWNGSVSQINSLIEQDQIYSLELSLTDKQLNSIDVSHSIEKLETLTIPISRELPRKIFDDFIVYCHNLEEIEICSLDFQKAAPAINEISGLHRLKRISFKGKGVGNSFIKLVNDNKELNHLDVSAAEFSVDDIGKIEQSLVVRTVVLNKELANSNEIRKELRIRFPNASILEK